MKKTFIYLLFFLFLTAFISSCEMLEDCKTCKLVTIENGDRTEGPGILYCGDKLSEKEDAAPVIIGNKTTFWECN